MAFGRGNIALGTLFFLALDLLRNRRCVAEDAGASLAELSAPLVEAGAVAVPAMCAAEAEPLRADVAAVSEAAADEGTLSPAVSPSSSSRGYSEHSNFGTHRAASW
jgi:CelD/BcsL family acetyltransferase involved in cellulose biosynthesis